MPARLNRLCLTPKLVQESCHVKRLHSRSGISNCSKSCCCVPFLKSFLPKLNQTSNQFLKRNAACCPELGVHADGSESRHGVDFVDPDLCPLSRSRKKSTRANPEPSIALKDRRARSLDFLCLVYRRCAPESPACCPDSHIWHRNRKTHEPDSTSPTTEAWGSSFPRIAHSSSRASIPFSIRILRSN